MCIYYIIFSKLFIGFNLCKENYKGKLKNQLMSK